MVIVTLVQLSVADALPKAASRVGGLGLPQINKVVPVAVIVGGVGSSVHVTVLEAVEVFPHASMALHVLVCDRPHPLLAILPSLTVTVGVPHASVVVAVPNAASSCGAVGLHDMLAPVVVIVGGVTSAVQVTVRDTVAVLPQASVAVNVLVCERLHAPVAVLSD